MSDTDMAGKCSNSDWARDDSQFTRIRCADFTDKWLTWIATVRTCAWLERHFVQVRKTCQLNVAAITEFGKQGDGRSLRNLYLYSFNASRKDDREIV